MFILDPKPISLQNNSLSLPQHTVFNSTNSKVWSLPNGCSAKSCVRNRQPFSCSCCCLYWPLFFFFRFFAHGIVIDWKKTSRIWCLMINILYVHIGHLSSCWEEMICLWTFNLRVFLMTGSPQHKTTETLYAPNHSMSKNFSFCVAFANLTPS